MKIFWVLSLVFALMACTASANTEVCADWYKLMNTLYVLENQTPENNETRMEALSACSVPQPLAKLQAAKDAVYGKLEGRTSCSLEEFANMLDEEWDQPMWLMEYQSVDGNMYHEAVATIVERDGQTWGVRVNLPKVISGLDKSIAGDGYLDASGNVVAKNKIKHVTEIRRYATA